LIKNNNWGFSFGISKTPYFEQAHLLCNCLAPTPGYQSLRYCARLLGAHFNLTVGAGVLPLQTRYLGYNRRFSSPHPRVTGPIPSTGRLNGGDMIIEYKAGVVDVVRLLPGWALRNPPVGWGAHTQDYNTALVGSNPIPASFDHGGGLGLTYVCL
jgi:hypothetical protein